MGTSWFVRPETCRLQLSEEQWLLVKRRLTAGEFRAHLKRSSDVGADDVRRIDTIEYSLSMVVAYLLDWSLDAVIRGVSEQDLIATLDSLDPSRFAEIKLAIEAHEAAMTVEREQEKNGTDGGKDSAAISPSPSAAAGALSGFVN
jgi:hypothetical protein